MKTRRNRWIALAGLAAVAGIAQSADAVIVPVSGVNGRFIRINNADLLSRNLHLSEVEAFAFGTAPNAGSGLSTNEIPATFEADGAVSGFATTGGHSFATSVTTNNALEASGAGTYSRFGSGLFHTIDLGATQNVGAVRLHQRADGCCQDRLANVTVSVLADNAGVPGAVLYTSPASNGTLPTLSQFNIVGAQEVRVAGAGTIGTEVVGDNTVRFIRIRNNNNGSQLLGIGEIEAFAAGVVPSAASGLSTNELTGLSFESQVAPAGVAHGANTAPFNNTLDSGAAVYTLNGAGSNAANEYVVDLNTSTDLGQVRLFNRTDCCQERLSNYTVSLLSDNGSGLPGEVLYTQIVPTQTPNTPAFTQINVPANLDAFTVGAADTIILDVDLANGLADLLKIGNLGTGALTLAPGASLIINVLSAGSGPQTFDVLDFGSVTGSFANITVNGPSQFNLSQLLITGQITSIVPEPMTASLGLMALAALATRTGRRSRA